MNQNNRRVVVTGMGAVSPVGNDVQTSWENLISGVHGIGPITRFDTTEYKAKLAAEVKDFDARKYMEKAETLRSDLYAQYALASACQAVEESGVLGTVDPERFAVYFGTGIGGINTFSREYKKLLDRGPSRVSPYFIPMLIANMGAGMIAIRFNCQGPALPAVTACASGSNAIGEAVRAIRHGYADVVISGGAEASINECGVAGFVNMQALSVSEDPDAASLPFDKRRAGFIIGEGAAAVVLEEYEHAVKRGAKIYGEVCGYGSTCDAYHITAPLPDAAGGARAMKQALEEAGYTGEERLYINAQSRQASKDKSEIFTEFIAHLEQIRSRPRPAPHFLGNSFIGVTVHKEGETLTQTNGKQISKRALYIVREVNRARTFKTIGSGDNIAKQTSVAIVLMSFCAVHTAERLIQ